MNTPVFPFKNIVLLETYKFMFVHPVIDLTLLDVQSNLEAQILYHFP
jgi:hypothetical protein